MSYQTDIEQFAVYPEAGSGSTIAMSYVTLGLNGEAGECAEGVKKAIRDDGGIITSGRRDALIKELGDVMWYAARLASELDVTLEEVQQTNFDKLSSRKERNLIHGEGSDR